MSIDMRVPKWVRKYILKWAKRLHLEDFQIVFKMVLSPGDMTADTYAVCWQDPKLNLATIDIRPDIENTFWWRCILVHELLHVKHSRIDQYLEKVVFPETGADCKTLAHNTYQQYNEAFIHSLACALVNAAGEGKDYIPEEAKPKKEKAHKPKS